MIYREQLDGMTCQGCDDPDCTGALWLHSRCHPDAPTWSVYEKDGTLRVLCAECDSVIAEIAVASAASAQ